MKKIAGLILVFCIVLSGCVQSVKPTSTNDTDVLFTIEDDLFYYLFNQSTFQTRVFLDDIVSLSEGTSQKSKDFLLGEMSVFSSSDNFVLNKIIDPIKNRKDSLVVDQKFIDPIVNIIALEKSYIKYISQNLNSIIAGADSKITLDAVKKIIDMTKDINLSKTTVKGLEQDKYLKSLQEFIKALAI